MVNPDPGILDLSILVLARNERIHIERCLRSAQQLGVQVFVIDSHSNDGTADLAQAMGAHVIQCSADRFADKLNWALSNVEFPTGWVMRLDADETLSEELLKALPEKLPKVPIDVSGVMLRRQLWFMGQWIKHGGVYPTWSMRLWRRGVARCESRDLDEHMLLSQGNTLSLPLDVIDNPLFNLATWIDKHNRYSTIEAEASGRASEQGLLKPRLFGNYVQRTRWIKINVFSRLPPFIRPVLYFIYRYVLCFGFLDGRNGLLFHFLHALWYRLLVDAKIMEQRANKLKKAPGSIP